MANITLIWMATLCSLAGLMVKERRLSLMLFCGSLTGDIPRLNNRGSIVSLYSNSGEAQVKIVLSSLDRGDILVTRRSDGLNDRLLLQQEDESFRGEDAERELIRRLWPEGMAANNPRSAMRVALERGVYLQQDMLTDFLTADSDNERFNAVSEIMGAG